MATTEKTTGRESDKFMLRLPDGMRDRIAEAAKANGRSMNAEIVARLDAPKDAPDPSNTLKLLSRLEHDLGNSELDNMQLHLQIAILATSFRMALHYIPQESLDADPELRKDFEAWLDAADNALADAEKQVTKFDSKLENLNAMVKKAGAAREELTGIPSEHFVFSKLPPLPEFVKPATPLPQKLSKPKSPSPQRRLKLRTKKDTPTE